MLKRLSVQNYVLIDQLDIQLGKGLSIITGETGAGKSIILGALGLMLGQRADSSLLQNKQKKCIIEGVFDIAAYDLNDFFEANELDYDKESTVRREITPEGKSRAFINDTPVSVSILKEFTSRLVDIHSQHETLLLQNSRFQLNVVDAYAQNTLLVKEYKKNFKAYRDLQNQLDALLEAESKSKSDLDYFNFQYQELKDLKLISGEQELLEKELERLEHAEEILQLLNRSTMALMGVDDNILLQLKSLQQQINTLKRFGDNYVVQSDRLNSVIVELKDIHDELEHATGVLSVDPNRLEQISERLSAIYSLQKKHRVSTVEDLITLQLDLEEKISRIGSPEIQIESTQKALTECLSALRTSGAAVTNSRQSAIPGIEKEIIRQLADLSMPHAVLRIALIQEKEEQFTVDGMEKIQFLFSANKGMDFKELAKVASGGEMSRLMLCIKSLLARLSAMPTVIFDEIDAGISGETAARVGNILKNMAQQHQVLAITHLPQMASKGDAHFLVYKEVKKGHTRSLLRLLNEEERVNEIARMLSGEELTPAALENARELLGQ